MSKFRAAPRRYLPGSPFNVPLEVEPVETFELHDQVTHDKYGLGVVLGVEEGVAVLVDFHPRRLRILAPYSKMTKL
ncbi:MAG TPA: hypothetical protein VMR14_19860 [Streptosporangiaceae bacterium]|jgi:hypothetical protein|nr:hypothetical protein [Streptosporangiaceae bacterium]